MLKTAKELSEVTTEVLQRQADELAKQKRIEALRIERENEAARLLEARHQEFERVAHEAAIEGKLFVALSERSLNETRLKQQGFSVRNVVRRSLFEEHLLSEIKRLEADFIHHCEVLRINNPGIGRLEDEMLTHRNPLVSFMENAWRRNQLTLPVGGWNIAMLIKGQRPTAKVWLDEKSPELENIATAFSNLKAVQLKHSLVASENQLVPEGMDTAIYVSWEASEDGGGLVENFTAQKLKWLANNWNSIATILNENLESAAQAGASELDLWITRNKRGWSASWDYSDVKEGGIEQGEEGDDDDEEGEYEDWFDICHPSIIVGELKKAGYNAMLFRCKPNGDDFDCTQILEPLSNQGEEAVGLYLVEVKWKVANQELKN